VPAPTAATDSLPSWTKTSIKNIANTGGKTFSITLLLVSVRQSLTSTLSLGGGSAGAHRAPVTTRKVLTRYVIIFKHYVLILNMHRKKIIGVAKRTEMMNIWMM
jgi:hypothetical protein